MKNQKDMESKVADIIMENVIWGRTKKTIWISKIVPKIMALFHSSTQSAVRKAEEREICICAALKLTNGMIIRGHQHGDCFHTARRMLKDKETDKFDMIMTANAEQGFVTSRNRFVTREEGRKLQDAAGIKSADPEGYRGKTLFSEDLY